MAFGAELKDFVSGFKSGYKMMEDSQNSKSRNAWQDANTKAINGPFDAAEGAAVKGAIPLTYNANTNAGGSGDPDLARAREAFAKIESDGSGGYDAIGPKTPKGDQAYGRYQVMGANVPQWTKEILGRAYTPEEFRKDPKAQDAVFDARFGGYLKKTGSVADAASMWFSGRPLADAGQASDGYNTTPQYVSKILKAYNAGVPPVQPAQKFADGGIIPYGSPDNPDVSRPQALPLSQGTPANVPLPPERPPELGGAQPQAIPTQPQQPQGDSGGGLGEALHGALTFLSNTFGLSQQNAALPGTDTKLKDGQKRFAQGEGAASPAEYQEVLKTVDPKGELGESARRVAAVNAVYRYWLDRGDVDKANKAAASLVQTARLEAAKYGTVALQALKSGDQQGAIKAIQAGYDATPDGKSLEVDAQTGTFRQVDSKSGQATGEGRITPEALIAAAEGLQNGSMYWEQVMTAAQQRDPAWQHRAERAGAPQVATDITPWEPKPIGGAAPGEPTGGAIPVGGGSAPQAAPATVPGSSPDVSSEEVTVTPESDAEGAGPDSGMGGTSDLRPGAIPTSAAQPGGLPPMKSFEEVYGPRPVMPNPPPGRPSAVNAWRQTWDEMVGKRYDAYKKDYDTKQAAARKEAMTVMRDDRRASEANQSREAAADRQARGFENQAKIQQQTQSHADKAAMDRERVKIEQEQRHDAKLPDVTPKELDDGHTELAPVMTEALAQLKDPRTGEPFGKPKAAVERLTQPFVDRITAFSTRVALQNRKTMAEGADMVQSLLSSTKEDPEGWKDNNDAKAQGRSVYTVSNPDKYGNTVIHIPKTGQTFRVPDGSLKEIEYLRKTLESKLKLAGGEKVATPSRAKAGWNTAVDAINTPVDITATNRRDPKVRAEDNEYWKKTLTGRPRGAGPPPASAIPAPPRTYRGSD